MGPMLVIQTVLPALLTGLFVLAERRGAWEGRPAWAKQVVAGVLFGLVAVLATETGVPVVDGGVVNVRDAAPLVAGLAIGAPAGVIAGVIGAAERWLCVLWGGGATTRLACSAATLVAGLAAAAMRRLLFDDRRPPFLYALGIGVTTEVLHMLLVLLTNMGNLAVAFAYVEECSVLMICLNGLATGLALVGQSYLSHESLRVSPPNLISDLGIRLFSIILAAFLLVTAFTFRVTSQLAAAPADGVNVAHVMLYLTVFMEIIVHTALFIVLFQLLRHRVVDNLAHIEEGLDSIAAGNLDTQVDVRTHQEFSKLSDDLNSTVDVLKGYIDEAERRMDADLALARRIQSSALPSVFPPFPERHDFDLYASMDPAREVGGDFYDFFLLDSHTLVFLVADVSGKGVPAALFMMQAKTELHALMESGLDVDEAMTEANRHLCEVNDSGMFVTAWLGRLDLAVGELAFANAGHNPPLLRHADGTYDYLRVSRPNLFLAGMEGTRYRRNVLRVDPGDSLFLYTDGVTEACDPSEAMYGEKRLLNDLNELGCAGPRQTCEGIAGRVAAFADGAEQSDDITMLAVDVAALRSRDRIVTQANLESIALVRDFFEERLPKLGASPRVANRVQVAVDEAYSNICNYGHATRAVASIIRKGADLLVEFADDGVPFDPTQAPEPDLTLPVEERPVGGLGIHMLRRMTRSMEYARADETNILTLTFEL